MSDEQLSIRDYPSTEHYIIDSTDDDYISRYDTMSQGTRNNVGYRLLLRWNSEHLT